MGIVLMGILKDIKVGDEVYVGCYTSMGASSEGNQTVTDVKVKFDEDTGEPYNVIYLGEHKFDTRNGGAINAPTMYYISEKV